MKQNRYTELTQSFNNKNLIILGDIMLDAYYWGEADRISPEAPVPIVQVKKENYRAGGAGNVALNIKGLGSSPLLIGVVGSGKNRDKLLEIFQNNSIGTDTLFSSKEKNTIIKTRVIAQNQQMLRFDVESTKLISTEIEDKIIDTLRLNIEDTNGLIFADYGKGVLTTKIISEAIQLSRENNVPIYVDPKTQDYRNFEGVYLLKPNLLEFESIVGKWKSENEFISLGYKLREKIGIKNLLVTRGAEGSTLFTKKQHYSIPTKALEVHDVSGAGDTAISTFALADLSGAFIEESALLANYAAGYVCGEVGVVPITLDNLTKIANYYIS